jgi:hypothetical protein
MGTGCIPIRSFQAGYREGVWSGKREENGPEGSLLVHILFPYSLPPIGSLP